MTGIIHLPNNRSSINNGSFSTLPSFFGMVLARLFLLNQTCPRRRNFSGFFGRQKHVNNIFYKFLNISPNKGELSNHHISLSSNFLKKCLVNFGKASPPTMIRKKKKKLRKNAAASTIASQRFPNQASLISRTRSNGVKREMKSVANACRSKPVNG